MEVPSNETKASLGCGTLILIAIIVAVFSNGSTKQDLEEIRQRLTRIEAKLDALNPPAPASIPAQPEGQ